MSLENYIAIVGIVIGVLGSVWVVGFGIMSYFVKKRDKKIDDHDAALAEHERSHREFREEVAKTYATKNTMMDLFKETSRTNELAIARVEKSIDTQNTTIAKLADTTNSSIERVAGKVDKVVDGLSAFQTQIMQELAKKT